MMKATTIYLTLGRISLLWDKEYYLWSWFHKTDPDDTFSVAYIGKLTIIIHGV